MSEFFSSISTAMAYLYELDMSTVIDIGWSFDKHGVRARFSRLAFNS
jgi:hypothetical protein